MDEEEIGLPKPINGPVFLYTAQFSKRNGTYIAAGGSVSNEVRLFDGDDYYKPFASINDLSRACFSLDFSNKLEHDTGPEMLATSGGDGVVRVFSVSKNSQRHD